MMWLRTIVFKFAFAVMSVVWALGILSLIVAPFRVRLRFSTYWSDITLWLLRVICNIRYEVTGREHIPEGSCVMVFNHQSTWETTFSPQVTRKLMWVLKRELLYIPFFGWAMATLHPVAINRHDKRNAMTQIIEQGRDNLVAAGLSVSMCPEGTRSPPDHPKPFKQGAVRLAEALDLPLLPIAHNAGLFWPKKGVMHPGTVQVVIFPVQRMQGKTAQQVTKELEALITGKSRELVADERKRREQPS